MAAELTQRCIEAIMRGENVKNPVVQFLNHKRITPGKHALEDKYRVIISDGIHFHTFAALTTDLNYLITEGELQENSIICLDQHVCSGIRCGKGIQKVLVILKLTILVKGDMVGKKIGTPVNYDEIDSTQQIAPATPVEVLTPHHTSARVAAPVASPMRGYNGNIGRSPQENKNILPIVALNPNQNRWVIKARVVQKGKIRYWFDECSMGKLFSMYLADASGAIRATAFNDACDKLYNMMELNKVYLFSRCLVKPASEEFTTTPHDFELTLNSDSNAKRCDDDQLNFTPLSALKDTAVDSFVDIWGDLQNLVDRTPKKELGKRGIMFINIISDDDFSVSLWDAYASNNPVVGWYDALDPSHEFNSISNRIGNEGVGGKLWTLKEALMNHVGSRNEADYFNVEATISFIQSDRAIYQACPNKERGCKKKLVDYNDGTYRCRTCNLVFPNFEYRLMLNVQICDWTGNQWITMSQEQAEALLGATATEVGRSSCDDFNDTNNYYDFFRKPLFKNYSFRVRAKMETETYNKRLKMSVVNFKPIDYKEACKRMIAEIKTLSEVSIANHSHHDGPTDSNIPSVAIPSTSTVQIEEDNEVEIFVNEPCADYTDSEMSVRFSSTDAGEPKRSRTLSLEELNYTNSIFFETLNYTSFARTKN